MKWTSKIGYWLLTGSCTLVGWLPRWFLYGPLRWTIFFVLYYLVQYRRRVIRTNLRNSFPEKSEREIRSIMREFYRHLSELFIDTVDLTSISRRALMRRVTITGLDEHEARVAGRDWIAAMSHYGSWEYFSVYQFYTSDQIVGVYHPLQSEAFDKFYRRMRSRTGMKPISSRMLLRYLVQHRGDKQRKAVGLIADQIPPFSTRYWLQFLNQPTTFYEGMEEVARRFNMPVYFLHLRKVGVARYEASLELIWDGDSPIEDYDITGRYAALLERQIREQPAYWLWSHRRWKRGPHPGSQILTLEKWQ